MPYSDDENTSRVSFTILEKQMTQIYTAERFSRESFFGLFYKVTTNCDLPKPINPLLISFARSALERIAFSVRKASGNTFPYRPRARL